MNSHDDSFVGGVDFLIATYADSEDLLPTYATDGDAGADLRAAEGLVIPPGCRGLVSTGVKLAIPKGYVGLIHPRSGLAAKHGITVLNTPGTIDSGYRGYIKVILLNTGGEAFEVEPGMRIAQLVIQQYEQVVFRATDAWDESTERGAGGFGSTGT